MAAASYTTDLTTIAVGNTATDTGTWAELSGHTSGSAAGDETDYYIQGTGCISQQLGNKGGTTAGIQYDYGSNITLATGECFFMWHVLLAGNAIDTFANGGMRFGIGSTSGNMYYWTDSGSDFGRNPYGGWFCGAVDPTTTADFTDGTPVVGNYRVFGSLPNLTSAVSKGYMHAVDAIRYGRGELIVTDGDLANGYATFSGIATQNDNNSNRWGLFQEEGIGYLWKGLMSLGTTATSVDFRDSNVNITVDDIPTTYATFNAVEINNASSRVDWIGVTMTAVNASQLSPGSFEVVDNATVNIDACTFTDLTTFIFQSNSTITDTTFRRCGQVTQDGSTVTGCLFDSSDAAAAFLLDSVDDVTSVTFESAGTGHAIQGFSTAGDYTLVDYNFTGYAATNGSTGNESIYVTATTGTVNLYLSGGSGTVSIRTAGATVNVIASATLTVGGVRAASDVWIYRADNKTLLASADPVTVTDGSPVDGVQYYKLVYSYDSTTLNGVATEIKVFNLGYVNERINYTLTAEDARVGVQQRIDRNYDNPT